MVETVGNGSSGRERGRRAPRAGYSLVLAVVLGVGLALPAVPAPSQEGFPGFATTAPERKQLVVRDRYAYRERRYEPPVLVSKVDAPLANDGHPETLAISQLSAMKNLDHDWWLSTWDPASRALIEARDAAAGRTPEERIAEWKAQVIDAGLTLGRWIEMGPYVVVTYRVWPTAEGAQSEEFAIVLKLSEGRWAATLDLEDNPVVQYFDAGSSEVERVIR